MIDRLVLFATLPFALASGAGGWTFAAHIGGEAERATFGHSVNLAAQTGLFGTEPGEAMTGDQRAPLPTVVRRANDGLFHTIVNADGRAVRMVIDTGATHTIMSSSAAKRHFPGRTMELRGTIRTVSGQVGYRIIDIQTFSVGSRKLKHLQIAVVDGPEDFALLGQDVLSRIGPIGINGEELTLP